MIVDDYGQQIYTETDLCDVYLSNPDATLKNVLVPYLFKFNPVLDLNNVPTLIEYTISDETIEEFDKRMSSSWLMPEEYSNFDIAKHVLDQCTCDAELQRAGEELLLFQEREMFPLLRYLKFLVDIMRENNIIWGVGRGSSVSSFVLYLLGVHRINSLEYDLDIKEFIKE